MTDEPNTDVEQGQEQTEAPTEAEPKPRIPNELAEKIFAARTELIVANVEYDRAAEDARLNKKNVEKLQAGLNRLIDDARQGIGPLFGTDEPKAEKEDWREVTMADVRAGKHRDFQALTQGIVDKLAEAGIVTVGDLTERQGQDGVGLLAISGIGSVALEKIDNAMLAFWAAHPEAADSDAADTPEAEPAKAAG